MEKTVGHEVKISKKAYVKVSTNKVKIKINSEQANALQTFLQSNKKEWSRPISVSEIIDALRKKDYDIASKILINANNPGCYKWWAEKEYVEKLLNKIFDNEKLKTKFSETEFDQIFEKNEENLYCIYVGKANNLYDRLRDHAKKTEQSTLRRTICSLTCNKDDSFKTINDKIDNWLKKFKIQYFPILEPEPNEKKSGNQILYKLKGTNCTLLDLEYFFINEAFHILNVDVNHFAEYSEKIRKQLDKETFLKTKKITTTLSKKKKQWPKKKIIEKKHQ